MCKRFHELALKTCTSGVYIALKQTSYSRCWKKQKKWMAHRG